MEMLGSPSRHVYSSQPAQMLSIDAGCRGDRQNSGRHGDGSAASAVDQEAHSNVQCMLPHRQNMRTARRRSSIVGLWTVWVALRILAACLCSRRKFKRRSRKEACACSMW